MGKITKFSMGVVIAAAAMSMMTANAYAGTGVYVGKDITSDGKAIIAGNFDEGEASPKSMSIGEKQWNAYKYLSIDKDAAVNEYGVNISAISNVTANEAAAIADPYYVKSGKHMSDIPVTIAKKYKTARSAVNGIAEMISKNGMAEGAAFIVADQYEAFYFESYTAHEFAAVKLASDAVSVFSDSYVIDSLDFENYDIYASDNLEVLAVENDFAVYNEDGSFNPAASYGVPGDFSSALRVWEGYKQLAPDAEIAFEDGKRGPIFVNTENEVDITDVFRLFRNRYQDEELDFIKEAVAVEPIAADSVSEAHVLQIDSDINEAICTTMWVNLSNAEFAEFVPVNSAAGKLPASVMNKTGNDSIATVLAKQSALCIENREEISEEILSFAIMNEAAYIHAERENQSYLDRYLESPDECCLEINEDAANYFEYQLETTKENCELIENWLLEKSDSSNLVVVGGKADADDDNSLMGVDVEGYADALGYEVTRDGDVITFTKDDKVIVISLAELEDTDIAEILEKEVVEEDEAYINEDTALELESLVKSKEDLEELIDREIEEVPAEGWDEEQALIQLSVIKEGILDFIAGVLGKDVEDLTMQDLRRLFDAKVIEEYANRADVFETINDISTINSNIEALVSGYFGLDAAQIIKGAVNGTITRDEATDIIVGIENDVYDLFTTYLYERMAACINSDIAAGDAVNLIEESAAALEDATKEPVTDEIIDNPAMQSVVETVEAMDADMKETLGNIFGIDVNECVEKYKNDANSEENIAEEEEIEEELEEAEEEEVEVEAEAETETETEDEAEALAEDVVEELRSGDVDISDEVAEALADVIEEKIADDEAVAEEKTEATVVVKDSTNSSTQKVRVAEADGHLVMGSVDFARIFCSSK